MKEQNEQLVIDSVACPDDVDLSTEEEPTKASLRADAKLVARCVAGEPAAWEMLYAQCHDSLCTGIRSMLRGSSFDDNLVDEIAARVWYALIDKDGQRLAKYSPTRGARVITYIRGIARDEIGRHYRAEVRRRRRETVAAESRAPAADSSDAASSPEVGEFLDTLTPAERDFCCEVLYGDEPICEQTSRSQASVWQLTHRVYKKLTGFLHR